MEPRDLFLSTMDDMAETIAKPTPYALLRSSALVRQLLIDGTRLVDVVNREARMKLTFEVVHYGSGEGYKGDPKDYRGPAFFMTLDGLAPEDRMIAAPLKQLTREQFLALSVLFVMGRPFTIQDIVKQCAIVLGGVHVDPRKEPVKPGLEQVEQVTVGGAAVPIYQMRSILKVVHKGLIPLAVHLKATPGSNPM